MNVYVLIENVSTKPYVKGVYRNENYAYLKGMRCVDYKIKEQDAEDWSGYAIDEGFLDENFFS